MKVCRGVNVRRHTAESTLPVLAYIAQITPFPGTLKTPVFDKIKESSSGFLYDSSDRHCYPDDKIGRFLNDPCEQTWLKFLPKLGEIKELFGSGQVVDLSNPPRTHQTVKAYVEAFQRWWNENSANEKWTDEFRTTLEIVKVPPPSPVGSNPSAPNLGQEGGGPQYTVDSLRQAVVGFCRTWADCLDVFGPIRNRARNGGMPIYDKNEYAKVKAEVAKVESLWATVQNLCSKVAGYSSILEQAKLSRKPPRDLFKDDELQALLRGRAAILELPKKLANKIGSEINTHIEYQVDSSTEDEFLRAVFSGKVHPSTMLFVGAFNGLVSKEGPEVTNTLEGRGFTTIGCNRELMNAHMSVVLVDGHVLTDRRFNPNPTRMISSRFLEPTMKSVLRHDLYFEKLRKFFAEYGFPVSGSVSAFLHGWAEPSPGLQTYLINLDVLNEFNDCWFDAAAREVLKDVKKFCMVTLKSWDYANIIDNIESRKKRQKGGIRAAYLKEILEAYREMLPFSTRFRQREFLKPFEEMLTNLLVSKGRELLEANSAANFGAAIAQSLHASMYNGDEAFERAVNATKSKLARMLNDKSIPPPPKGPIENLYSNEPKENPNDISMDLIDLTVGDDQ